MNSGFDFEKHSDAATKMFGQVRPRYVMLAEQVHRIVHQSFDGADDISIHKIEYRAKDSESFRIKCMKAKDDNSPKYTNPIKEITDLSGVRVILFFPDDIKKVCHFIENNFSVVEKLDVGEARYSSSGIFGYQSIHYLVRMPPERLKLPDFKQFTDMVCEIQVRTILQHAWAEMEHDIQYKSPESLPREIKRKFTALAGMLEIADREFQSIQYEDQRLRKLIKKSLEEQLTREGIAAHETARSDQQKPVQGDIGSTSTSLGARKFVITGNFAQAIEVYSKQINDEPNAHTPYLGRAKARFLAGDRDGALQDIDSAKLIMSDDPAIEIVRQQIESGNVQRPAQNSDKSSIYHRMGNEALAAGKGEAAFDHFSEAQSGGYNYVFSVFNMAMACTLVRDFAGARRFLSDLRPTDGSPMMLNYMALICIIGRLENTSVEEAFAALREKRLLMNVFSYKMSPIRVLESGLLAKDGVIDESVDEIINVLRGPVNE